MLCAAPQLRGLAGLGCACPGERTRVFSLGFCAAHAPKNPLIKLSYQVAATCSSIKYHDRGQRNTPVTDARGIVEVIMLLPATCTAHVPHLFHPFPRPPDAPCQPFPPPSTHLSPLHGLEGGVICRAQPLTGIPGATLLPSPNVCLDATNRIRAARGAPLLPSPNVWLTARCIHPPGPVCSSV